MWSVDVVARKYKKKRKKFHSFLRILLTKKIQIRLKLPGIGGGIGGGGGGIDGGTSGDKFDGNGGGIGGGAGGVDEVTIGNIELICGIGGGIGML